MGSQLAARDAANCDLIHCGTPSASKGLRGRYRSTQNFTRAGAEVWPGRVATAVIR